MEWIGWNGIPEIIFPAAQLSTTSQLIKAFSDYITRVGNGLDESGSHGR